MGMRARCARLRGDDDSAFKGEISVCRWLEGKVTGINRYDPRF